MSSQHAQSQATGHQGGGSHASSAHDMSAHVKVYMMVFAALAVLTVVTVAVSYLHMPVGPAIAVALVIASFKASLVALFFMHLKGEVRSVVWTLLLTAVFFIALMTIPLSWYLDGPKHPEGTGPTARSLTTHEAH
jgi:cytochrome c oxidase subunit 4